MEQRQSDLDRELARERERIARELESRTIRQLSAAGLMLQAARALSDQDEVSERINAAVDELDDVIRALRSVIFGLEGRA